jgi:hypothetical protein
MVTFEEFLVRFNEEIEETFESSELSDNARAVVISTMKRYFRGKKYDPIELMAVFEGVCVATMTKDEPKRKSVLNRIKKEANHYVTEEPDFTRFPDITFEEAEEMRAMGR